MTIKDNAYVYIYIYSFVFNILGVTTLFLRQHTVDDNIKLNI